MREWFDAEDEDPELRIMSSSGCGKRRPRQRVSEVQPVPPPVPKSRPRRSVGADLERLSALAETLSAMKAEAELQKLFKVPHYEGLPALPKALEGLAAEVGPRNRRAASGSMTSLQLLAWLGSIVTNGGDPGAHGHIKQAQVRRLKLLGPQR